MTAPPGHNPVKKSAEDEAKSADAATSPKDPRRPNPVWQSLAVRSGIVQAKLTVGKADDPYEREADRVADQVIATGFTPASLGAEPMCGDAVGGPAPAPSPAEVRRAGVPGGGGEPLAPAARGELEARIGPQVDRIRVHAGGEAASRAAEMNARAYTVGGHIYFAAPASTSPTPPRAAICWPTRLPTRSSSASGRTCGACACREC